MKKIVCGFILAAVLIGGTARAADAIEPAQTNIVNRRTDSVSALGGVYFTDSTLRLSNCIMFTASGATQSLEGVFVNINVGNTTTNIAYTGRVYVVGVETNRWTVDINVPDISGTVSIQTKITNATTSFIYQWKNLSTTEAL